ncbi:MAG: hypothetical protein ACRDJC_06905, partial [Thermomicrobiales bacterium]
MDDDQLTHLSQRMRDGFSRRSALRRLGVGGVAAGTAIGFERHVAGAQSALTTAATEAAARRAVSAINQALASGDTSALDSAFAADYVNHTPRRSPATGQP